MSFHFRKEIDDINRRVIALSAAVEKSVNCAIKALEKRDVQLAKSVVDNDMVIDQLEVELEEECLKILALHQPVAIDLRYIVAILKINNDLERIGDLAVNLASGAKMLSRQEKVTLLPHIHEMAKETVRMLHLALESVLNFDPVMAKEVLLADDKVDDLHKRTYDIVEDRIQENPADASGLIRLLGISRNFERMADHATNIAEDAIYMTSGEIARHPNRDIDDQ